MYIIFLEWIIFLSIGILGMMSGYIFIVVIHKYIINPIREHFSPISQGYIDYILAKKKCRSFDLTEKEWKIYEKYMNKKTKGWDA